ncbi:vWA domain-containing protein [Bacillus vallismortis]|uniref:vWA domain-containing protein n=1 Tax=Bacillus vallismortis TaxID=72361 RepID=UPI000EF44484|nr:VWA domain-containing protein [Bacillus vallismortis]MCY7918188.1 VWA domain-containing protein [Bacillus vallismortis]
MKKLLAASIIGLLTVSFASPSFAAEKQADTNVAVLFDGSGSMVQKTGGERKIDIAKKSVKSFAELLPKDTNLMLRVFGHAGNNKLSGKALSCGTTETIYGLHPYEGSLFDNSLSEIKPTGWTPIAKALSDTRKELEAFDANGKNVVYVITDGEETCGGDPAAEIEKLREANVDTIVNIIGFNFDVKGNEEMKQAAVAGGGEYISAASADEFEQTWEKEAQKFTE